MENKGILGSSNLLQSIIDKSASIITSEGNNKTESSHIDDDPLSLAQQLEEAAKKPSGKEPKKKYPDKEDDKKKEPEKTAEIEFFSKEAHEIFDRIEQRISDVDIIKEGKIKVKKFVWPAIAAATGIGAFFGGKKYEAGKDETEDRRIARFFYRLGQRSK